MSTEHTGATPADCPACRPNFKTAQHLQAARVRKVYGRVSANARREHAATQRTARAIFDRLFQEHRAALRAQESSSPVSHPHNDGVS
jgi:hypothetical protein